MHRGNKTLSQPFWTKHKGASPTFVRGKDTMASSSRSPRRQSDSRFRVAQEDLAIKYELLYDKFEKLDKEVKKLRESANWLCRLYGWLHRFFANAPRWPYPASEEGVWVDPV